ncbi:MAG: glycosyltransferase [Candidatus Kerfeldbacteria bacterium]|nr:glycosyltransferase [Candidatus Kerfeldbacteria bacterium]
MKFISVCIPTYEMNGRGRDFLQHSFDILIGQTCKDFEVVISDHSRNDEIRKLCTEYSDRLDIRYFHNSQNIGSSSANLNHAIRHACGELIKVLFQDDFLYSQQSLQIISDSFDLQKDNWLVTASQHTKDGVTFERPYFPKVTKNPHLGNNLIGSPSVLTIKNDFPLLFDERLIWFMDGEYYKRCLIRFGQPKIVRSITVVNRQGAHQVTHTAATEAIRQKELDYVTKKYPADRPNLSLSNVTLVTVSSVKLNATIRALEASMDGIDFGSVLLVSDKKPANLPTGVRFEKCVPINNINEYSQFILYKLSQYITTNFALVIQYDGFVLRPHKWHDRFLEYDFIGAPWPAGIHWTEDGTNVRVGNGGFSLRSKKLLDAFHKLNLPFTDAGTGYFNEDGNITNYHREQLEAYGVRFAPVEVAVHFSREADCPESVSEPFGFHKHVQLIPHFFWLKHFIKKRLAKA